MASTTTRRPLPALIALLALLILAAVVWWRVLNRGSSAHVARPCPTHSYSVHLPAQADVSVLVLNSTRRTGIAGKARSTLVSDGFNSPVLARDDNTHAGKIAGVAEIRYGPKARAGAELLRYYFPGAAMKPMAFKSSTVVVSLGNKYRAVASPKAVAAQLAKIDAIAGTPTPQPSPAATC